MATFPFGSRRAWLCDSAALLDYSSQMPSATSSDAR